MSELSRISGVPVPSKYRRQRSQLQDAMLDAHFFIGGKRIVIGAEPDLLWALSMSLSELGAKIAAAVTTTQSPLLELVPTAEVVIGDLEDLEQRARGCDLMVTHSHGRQAAQRLQIPLHRAGLPMFDRLGAGQRVTVGYRGTREFLCEIGNIFLAHPHEAAPDSWPVPETSHASDAAIPAH